VIDDRAVAALVAELGVPSQRTGAVLLVDDEQPNLTVLREFLEEERWRVLEAPGGGQALAIAEVEPVDVVVTDQRMPGMTGVELLETLRERKPDVAGIVLTAYGDLQVLESAINRARAFRFLRKPWEPAEILQAVEQAAEHAVQKRTIAALVGLLAARSEELRRTLDEVKAQHELVLRLERLGTIGQLAAGVTHDLKHVIVALRAADWEMQSATVPAPLREIVTLGLAGVESLLRTLQTLHEYVRTGAVGLELAGVEPAGVVHDALAITRMDLAYRLRRVTAEVAPGLPRLRADRQKLVQVLVNLLRNALAASPDGAAVRVVASGRPGEVELAVEDEGAGVPPDRREKVFEPFVSGKGQEGLGLGLYMARLVVEQHRGRIRVTDRPGGPGARFEVILPALGAV
jgi:signal transduction histidine kinase